MNSDEETPPVLGWILYDDSCGICRRWVPFWETALRRRGYGIAPMQAEWVSVALKIDRDTLLDDFRLLLADGRLVSGADVYRHAMRRIWWAWPLYLFSITPGLRQCFDAGYRAFARHRHRLSRSCGLR